MTARLGFVDLLQGPEYYSTRTITDSTATGSAVGTLPASNLFNRNLGKPWKRTGLASADTCKLDLDFVRVRPDRQAESGSPQCAGIGMIVVAGISAVTSGGGYPYQINVTFHATTNAFADSGGTNPYPSPGTHTLGPPHASATRSVVMCPVNGYSGTVGGVPYDFGASGSKIGRYIRIMVTPFWSGGGTCDVSIGRIMVMQTIAGSLQLETLNESSDDRSETVTSYDGTPYTLTRPSARRVGFTLVGMTNSTMRYAGLSAFTASAFVANRMAALGADAVFIHQDDSGYSAPEYNYGTIGRMASPLNIKTELPGVGATGFGSVSGEVIETPF